MTKLTTVPLLQDLPVDATVPADRVPPPPRPPERPRRLTLRRPDFVTESAGLSPAERGTANHLFLQFARLVIGVVIHAFYKAHLGAIALGCLNL